MNCELSLKESDGWFCESNVAWQLRKNIHHEQDSRNRASNNQTLFFQDNWEPTVHCEFERRLGNFGDGGKWVCDINRYRELNDKKQLIYSFGCFGDFTFEQAIKKVLPNAEIHTFDVDAFSCPENICTFHQVRLGSKNDNSSKTLQMVIEELGHTGGMIDLLKADIEGYEYEIFEDFFNLENITNSKQPTYIRQILFEIHIIQSSTNPVIRTHNLFELFRKNSYAIFHKEPNLMNATRFHEYALIRLNPAFFMKI